MMKFSQIEKNDLFKAWTVISIAFANVFFGLSFSPAFLVAVLFSGITVGIGFLLHELAHKYVAVKYGCWAEFRSFDQMLLLALLMSFFGFIFAAPGAVMIHGRHITRAQNGRISIAGPLTNYALAIAFLALVFAPISQISFLGKYGFMINAWIGLFNTIPLWQFDGRKILEWSKLIWGLCAAAGIALMMAQPYLFVLGNGF